MRTVLVALLVGVIVLPAAAQVGPPVPGPLRVEAQLSSAAPLPVSIVTVGVRVRDGRGRPVVLETVDAIVYWRSGPLRYASLPTSRFGATAIAIEIPSGVEPGRTYTVLVRASYRGLRGVSVLRFTPRRP